LCKDLKNPAGVYSCAANIQEHLDYRSVKSAFVFCTENWTLFSPRNDLRHFKTVKRKAGLPETYQIHDLCPAFASYLLSQNTPRRYIQEIVGHASFSTKVDIYRHLMPVTKRDAARKMDDFFGNFGIP